MFRGRLSNRSVVRVVGKEASIFLQGLFTNDLRTLQAGGSIFGCFLNQNGRVMFDAILHQSRKETTDGVVAIYLDVDKSMADVATDHLKAFKLRRKVKIDNLGDQVAVVVTNDSAVTEAAAKGETAADQESEMFVDPRSSLLTTPIHRVLVPQQWAPPMTGDVTGYNAALLEAGIGEGPSVFVKDKTLPFEGNVDMLSGVSFHKGCYLGQELTHRTHVMLVTRKRCVPIVLGTDSNASTDASVSPAIWQSGSNLSSLFVENQKVGTVMQVAHNRAVGLVRLRFFDPTTRSAQMKLDNGTAVTAALPKWWNEETIAKIFKSSEADS